MAYLVKVHVEGQRAEAEAALEAVARHGQVRSPLAVWLPGVWGDYVDYDVEFEVDAGNRVTAIEAVRSAIIATGSTDLLTGGDLNRRQLGQKG